MIVSQTTKSHQFLTDIFLVRMISDFRVTSPVDE